MAQPLNPAAVVKPRDAKPDEERCSRLRGVGRTRIKLCGMTRREDVLHAVELGADAIGMVFYPPSPRFVSIEQAIALTRGLPPLLTVMGLFVNAEADWIRQVVDAVPLSMLQFHGDAGVDTPERCRQLAQAVGLPWVRALRVGADTAPADLLKWRHDYAAADANGVLLDTLVDSYGGGGKVFDWSIIPEELAHQAVLSGGLNAHNVRDAVRRVRPYAVDVSSGIEDTGSQREKGEKGVKGVKGVKDHAQMTAFVHAVYAADAE
jgi:phosphoribosylanthranilate isomerase